MPLLVRLHLTSRTDRPSPTEQSSLCLLLLLFFQLSKFFFQNHIVFLKICQLFS